MLSGVEINRSSSDASFSAASKRLALGICFSTRHRAPTTDSNRDLVSKTGSVTSELTDDDEGVGTVEVVPD